MRISDWSSDVCSSDLDRLNQPGRDQMAVMWEAVFLHALDQVVPIRLEVALSNGRQPDFGLNSIAKEQDCRSSVPSRTCRMLAWTGRIRSQNSAVKPVGWAARIGRETCSSVLNFQRERRGKITK